MTIGQMMKMVNKGEERVVGERQEREEVEKETLEGLSWFGNLWRF